MIVLSKIIFLDPLSKIPFYLVPVIVFILWHSLSFLWGLYVACQRMTEFNKSSVMENSTMENLQ